VELPAQAHVDGQLRSDLPLVLHVREKLPGAVGRKRDRQIASHLARLVQQKAGQRVSEAGVGAWDGGLVEAIVVAAARAEGLRLQKLVTNATQVEAPFHGMP